MDVFLEKSYKPMLIGREEPAFDDDDFLFELKLDGIRCLAYLEDNNLSLVSRRGLELAPRFPELHDIRNNLSGNCVLDGELVVLNGGIPDFEKAKERALATDSIKIARMAESMPTTFVVFDLLYLDGKELVKQPLVERKKMLEAAVEENSRIALTRVIEGKGIAFAEATKEQGLEGIIAKRRRSLYYPGKRTTDWVKCKTFLDDDFVICGYIRNVNDSISLVLGQYDEQHRMVYCGHVVLNQSKTDDYAAVLRLKTTARSPFAGALPANNEHAIWVEPNLVCRCTFLSRTEVALMRHPVFKELRIDKAPDETVAPNRPSIPAQS